MRADESFEITSDWLNTLLGQSSPLPKEEVYEPTRLLLMHTCKLPAPHAVATCTTFLCVCTSLDVIYRMTCSSGNTWSRLRSAACTEDSDLTNNEGACPCGALAQTHWG